MIIKKQEKYKVLDDRLARYMNTQPVISVISDADLTILLKKGVYSSQSLNRYQISAHYGTRTHAVPVLEILSGLLILSLLIGLFIF